MIESEATETQPSSDEESEETDRPETDKTPEAKVADERQAAPTETSKELEDENAKAARAETGKAPEAKVADENQGAQTDTSKGLKDGKAEAAPAETGRTPEVKLTDLTEAVGTKHDSATAKTATEIGKGAEPKLSGKENTADGKAGQPPIPPKKKAPPGWPIIDCSQSSAELDKKLTDCMTALYGETLVQDVEGAQMLLSFVTRNGLQEDKKIDNATIQKLVETRERMRAGTFDAEKEEVDFRKSYGIVAKAADPVNVASLRESTDKQVRHPWLHPWTKQLHSTAGNACLKYRNLAFLVLIALLICQIYWTILSSVLNKTDALSDEINKAPTNAEYDQLEAVRQKTATVTNQPETNKPGPPPTVPAQASPTPTFAAFSFTRFVQSNRRAASSSTARRRAFSRCASRNSSGSRPARIASSSMNDSRPNVLAVTASARYDPCRNGGSDPMNRAWFFATR